MPAMFLSQGYSFHFFLFFSRLKWLEGCGLGSLVEFLGLGILFEQVWGPVVTVLGFVVVGACY